MIIRTLGTAGEKYQKLLDSIKKLTPQPKETIVVLPEGYDLPKEQIGNETFYFSPKGMVIQRLYGLEKCKTQYALFCDDDVEFEGDFVAKLFEPINNGLCGLSAGPLYSFLPKPGVDSFIDFIITSAMPSLFRRKNYISVLNSTGYSYNRHLKQNKIYFTQSLPWTCFFADVNSMKRIKLSDEVWLDKNGFAALDDQTMFYKAYLMSIKTCVVTDAIYLHNDAKTSTSGTSNLAFYSGGFNKIVFWHRFLYKTKQSFFLKKWSKLCLMYNYLMFCLFFYLSSKKGSVLVENVMLYKKGFKDGKQYLKSDEYKNLPDY